MRCQKLQNDVYGEKKLWPLLSGYGVFLQTLNFPVKRKIGTGGGK